MKHILILLTIFSLCMPVRAGKKEIDKARSHYTELVSQSTNSIQWLTQPMDAELAKEIEEGIAFSDDCINAALIQIVYLKSSRFMHDLPIKKNPEELSAFRSIPGLQEFITAQLAVNRPNEKVILTALPHIR